VTVGGRVAVGPTVGVPVGAVVGLNVGEAVAASGVSGAVFGVGEAVVLPRAA
jgi:hypothetical protein